MIKYFIPKGATSMMTFDPESSELNSVEEMYTLTHRLYEIPEDGEFKDTLVSKGDFIIVFWDFHFKKEYHSIIKQGTDLYRMYREIADAKIMKESQLNCCGTRER